MHACMHACLVGWFEITRFFVMSVIARERGTWCGERERESGEEIEGEERLDKRGRGGGVSAVVACWQGRGEERRGEESVSMRGTPGRHDHAPSCSAI